MEAFKLSDEALVNELYRRNKCSQISESQRIILIGPPGSGKATHSQKLMHRFCLCHIKTSNLIKKEVKNETTIGRQIKTHLMQGELMPNALLNEMVDQYLSRPECKHGAILDGFPKTLEQAQSFDNYLEKKNQQIWKALYFQCDDDLVKQRLKGRLIHLSSGRSYNLQYNPPQTPGLDDYTNEPLVKKIDDKEELIEKRIQHFYNKTVPMINYYKDKGVLAVINGNESIRNVWKQLKDVFKGDKLSEQYKHHQFSHQNEQQQKLNKLVAQIK